MRPMDSGVLRADRCGPWLIAESIISLIQSAPQSTGTPSSHWSNVSANGWQFTHATGRITRFVLPFEVAIGALTCFCRCHPRFASRSIWACCYSVFVSPGRARFPAVSGAVQETLTLGDTALFAGRGNHKRCSSFFSRLLWPRLPAVLTIGLAREGVGWPLLGTVGDGYRDTKEEDVFLGALDVIALANHCPFDSPLPPDPSQCPCFATYAAYPVFSLLATVAALDGSREIRVVGCLNVQSGSLHDPKYSISKHAPITPPFTALYLRGGTGALIISAMRIWGYFVRAPDRALFMLPGTLANRRCLTGISPPPPPRGRSKLS
jgi:hypothetical protein